MFDALSFLVQIFFLRNVKLVSLSSFCTSRCISTFTSAAVKPLHVSVTEKVWDAVGITPDDDMFNFGVFKAVESDDSTVIVYGSCRIEKQTNRKLLGSW